VMFLRKRKPRTRLLTSLSIAASNKPVRRKPRGILIVIVLSSPSNRRIFGWIRRCGDDGKSKNSFWLSSNCSSHRAVWMLSTIATTSIFFIWTESDLKFLFQIQQCSLTSCFSIRRICAPVGTSASASLDH